LVFYYKLNLSSKSRVLYAIMAPRNNNIIIQQLILL